MSNDLIERAFPGLRGGAYRVTSPASRTYNCIAWAAGAEDQWWWPFPVDDAYWPAEVPREESITAFIRLYVALGYAPCEDARHEPGFEKVALYARDQKPTHAARQLGNGLWTSKLGRAADIEHALDGLEGDLYGTVVQVLKRPLAPP